MFFGLTSPCTRARRVAAGRLDQPAQRLGPIGMGVRGRHQVRLQANVVEDRIARELHRDLGTVGGRRMNSHETIADRPRNLQVGPAITQLGFPEPVPCRVEIGHDQHAARRVLTEERWHGVGHDRRRLLHPGRFVGIALDRREPVLLDPELGERPLDADRPGLELRPARCRSSPRRSA